MNAASPRVLNKHRDGVPPGAVYVGRPSKWGNPFSHLPNTLARHRVGSRDEAVDAYAEWLKQHPEIMDAARRELRGKDLVCWCAPRRCHAEVLLQVANEDPT